MTNINPRLFWSRALLVLCQGVIVCVGLAVLAGPASAAGKTKPKAEPKTRAAEVQSEAGSANTNGESTDNAEVRVDGKKARVLTFGALDVEGKMRTPQLLFFLNRVKAELDSTTELRRSFMKELNATAKEKGL